jgi:hypothetical protein
MKLQDVSKITFLSSSYVSKMERGDRDIPPEVERILDLKNGTRWYQCIMAAIFSGVISDEDAKIASDAVEKIIGL